MAGARIHDYTNSFWKQDVDILVGGAGKVLSYITIPKCTSYAQANEMIAYIQKAATFNGVERVIPVHILIETHGALKQAVHEIAKLPWITSTRFRLDGFCQRVTTEQFQLLRCVAQVNLTIDCWHVQKLKLVAAALANGVVPAHNVTLDLKNVETTHSDASRARNEFGFLAHVEHLPYAN